LQTQQRAPYLPHFADMFNTKIVQKQQQQQQLIADTYANLGENNNNEKKETASSQVNSVISITVIKSGPKRV